MSASMMASKRCLYWGSGGVPGWKVNATLREKGLDFESKLVQFSKGALLGLLD
jgi:glutathione S-transferase